MIVKGFHVNPEVPSWPDFWTRVETGAWEPKTFALMDRFLEPGWRWVDFGAWIGPTALYAATKEAIVHAYEPDPVALRGLYANIRLNPDLSVFVHEQAIGVDSGEIEMRNNHLGNSETSIYGDGKPTKVWCRDVKSLFQDHKYSRSPLTIIKMDIEGAEFEILPYLKRFINNSRCIWIVSFHDPVILPYPNPEKRLRTYLKALQSFDRLQWYDEDMNLLSQVATVKATALDPRPQTLVFRR